MFYALWKRGRSYDIGCQRHLIFSLVNDNGVDDHRRGNVIPYDCLRMYVHNLHVCVQDKRSSSFRCFKGSMMVCSCLKYYSSSLRAANCK